MEQLAGLLQQAQAAVLSAQADIATLRTQLDDFGDEAIVNPCVVDLQVTIQQKQEAASEVLKRGAGLFYESMGELEERARALGNVNARERELEKTKKAMQRYFEAQKKTQDELKDEYDGLLSVREDKLAHMADKAAAAIETAAARRLQRRVLGTWLKKAMVRSFWRLHQQHEERAEFQHVSATQDHDAVSEEFLVTKLHQLQRQQLFHLWSRKTQRRANDRLRAEVAQLEKEADFFRSECASTQRVLSSHLQDEHARMQLTTHAKAKECELLDDEVGRLKLALAEITGEFCERTQTYVRQQEETELFFKRKEQKLRDALVETQAELDKLRAYTKRFHTDVHALETSMEAYTVGIDTIFWEGSAQKEALFTSAATAMLGRLAQRHKSAVAEVAELRANVELLSPLSEKVLRVENELAVATELSNTFKKGARETQRQLDATRHVASLLTDQLARATHHKLRSCFFVRWATGALAKRTRTLQAEQEALQCTLKTRQRDFLVQQQGTAASHREERNRLLAEIEDQKTAVKNLRKELAEAQEQCERKEGQNYEAQMDIHTLRARLTRSEQEKQSALEKLAAARLEGLKQEEDIRRYSLECKEVKWRWGLHQQHVAAWREQVRELNAGTAQLTAVCEQWREHCEQLEATHVAANQKQRHAVAQALLERHNGSQCADVFAGWHRWVAHQRALRSASARHEGQLKALSAQHTESQRSAATIAQGQLAAAHQQREDDVTALEARHALEVRRQQSEHEGKLQQARKQHTEKLVSSVSDAKEKQVALEKELSATQRKLDEVGDLVVFYCAQAAFAKWHAFASQRRAARKADTQLQHYRRAAQAWMTTRAELITQRYQEGDDVLMGSVTACHREDVAAHVDQCTALLDRNQQLSALFDEVTTAGEKLEAHVAASRAEGRRLRVELESEKDCAAALKEQLAVFAAHHSARNALAERGRRHHVRQCDLCEEHLRQALALYEASCRQVNEKHQKSLVSQLREATARAEAMLAVSRIDTEKEESVLSDSVGGDGKENAMDEVQALLANRDVDTLTSSVLVVPDVIQSRLDTLEVASRSLGQCPQQDASSLESIEHALAQPFSSEGAQSTVAAGSRLPERRQRPATTGADIGAALEVVRQSAMQLVAHERTQQRASTETSAQQLVGVEETLQGVLHSMETMLDEQRSLTAEMKSEHRPQQPRGPKTLERETLCAVMPPSDVETQTGACQMDAWAERLDMLASRYQRVLDAFSNSVEERRETFYSVNGMLVATEMFSDELLRHFEANMQEMQRLQSVLGPKPQQPVQEASRTTTYSHGTSPVNPATFLAEQHQQREWLAQLQAKLTDVARAYEQVLQAFLSSVREGQSSFLWTSSVLQEADQFSERLVGRLRHKLSDLGEAKATLAAQPERTLANDFSAAAAAAVGEADTDAEVCAALAGREEEQQQQPPSSTVVPSPFSVSSSSPTVPQLATFVTAAMKPETEAKVDSPEKIILRDRVELLEKLLVQSKLQLAETREILAVSGSLPSLDTNRQHEQDGDADAGSVLAALQKLRVKEKETQKAHEAQLIRVRADTEQLVAMRYREEMQRCEANINGLLEKIEDNNRFYESEKSKLEHQIESLQCELAHAASMHERAADQMRRGFLRDIDELSQEIALLQEEMQNRENEATATLKQALAQQKELLALQQDAKTSKLLLEMRQLTHEKESLQQRRAATTEELRRAVAAERSVLVETVAQHQAELAELEARHASILPSNSKSGSNCAAGEESPDALSLLHTRTSQHLSALHEAYDSTLKEKAQLLCGSIASLSAESGNSIHPPVTPALDAHEIAAYHDAVDTLAADVWAAKFDCLVDSSVAAMEAYYAELLSAALENLACDREEMETECMQLREQVAALEAEAEDAKQATPLQAQEEIEEEEEENDLTGGGKAALSPSVPHSQSPEHRPREPAENTPMVLSRGFPPRRSTTSQSTPRTEHSGLYGVEDINSPPPTTAAHLPPPPHDEPSPPFLLSVTPTRSTTRSRSLDSLELSQQLLRYSRQLHAQEERNAERLSTADALTAQVEDLIARGERLREFAERENFTPKRSTRTPQRRIRRY